MKRYAVTITEKLEMTVEVEASSIMEARDMVQRQYYDGEHVLMADNFRDDYVSFKAKPLQQEHVI